MSDLPSNYREALTALRAQVEAFKVGSPSALQDARNLVRLYWLEIHHITQLAEPHGLSIYRISDAELAGLLAPQRRGRAK